MRGCCHDQRTRVQDEVLPGRRLLRPDLRGVAAGSAGPDKGLLLGGALSRRGAHLACAGAWMIDLNNADFVLGFWVVVGRGWNWLACAYHIPGAWHLMDRTRFVLDGKFTDCPENKSWTCLTAKTDGRGP